MIHSFAYAVEKVKEVGKVIYSDRSIAVVSGLPNAVIGEGVSFETGAHGLVSKLGEDQVEVIIFSDQSLTAGEPAARTGEAIKVSVGDGMLGDTFDSLGYIVRGEKDPSMVSENRAIECPAWEIERRSEITKFCTTGTGIVDMVVPIGRGQRELVIGDQKTGKTHFALQVVKAQAKEGVICVICLIGKEQAEILRVEKDLTQAGVRDKCIIIAEPAKSSAAKIMLAPFTAIAVAEHFRDLGKDTLVVLDDLSHHAVRYREMALLADRFPGRDSYPSDVFYLHARLLERAGCFLVGGKAVSITCLPIVSTVDGDISGYIETNIMSMTDGHLYFDRDLFFDGVRPAVNVFLSVTRVGRQTQNKLMRSAGQKILSTLSEYGNLKRFLRFGAELSPEVTEKIRLAHGVKAIFRQGGHVLIDPYVQVFMVALLWADRLQELDSEVFASNLLLDKDKMREVKGLVLSANSFEELVKKAGK